MQAAEDIASETFLSALETWPYKGIPENATAWLYVVAKNKAKNYCKRNALFNKKIANEKNVEAVLNEDIEIDLSEKNISDSQLQMLFAVCHPAIPPGSQVALALRILCGFGIDEIATAFLTSKDTINKRLFRAKQKLKAEKIAVLPAGTNGWNIAGTPKRLDAVLTTLYLLFNEGYYSESNDSVIRKDLCLEAMRLTYLLIENNVTSETVVPALFSLMCFQSSRLDARKDSNGVMILYDEQDEKLWNSELIAKGAYFLHLASKGNTISKYHLEAAIAYWHTVKAGTASKWENILQLYNKLLLVSYSPVAALNRIYALSKTNGKQQAILEAENLQLTGNHYYFTLLGELYKGIDNGKAYTNFKQALLLAKTNTDKEMILSKLNSL
jgi:RNA polymerase sigma-70 factor (ECF subfamily)